MKSLELAIDDLYEAFADTAKPKSIEACECCVDDRSIKTLLTTSLREIKPDDLSSYASSAFLTAGDVPDYLYFLPRILEVSSKDEWWWPDIAVTGKAISNTDPNNWPSNRRQALDEFLGARLLDLIKAEDSDAIDDWLCAIARMGVNVQPFLEIIETSPAMVAEYYRANYRNLHLGKLSNAFWELPNEGHEMIVQWLHREDIAELGNEYVP
jgi:hypothetical protein